MRECQRCDNWNGGRGNRACMRCQVYKEIQLQSVRRKTVDYDVFPETIMDQFPAIETQEGDLLDTIRHLPTEQGAVFVLREYLGLHVKEVAAELKISERTVKERYSQARASLRISFT